VVRSAVVQAVVVLAVAVAGCGSATSSAPSTRPVPVPPAATSTTSAAPATTRPVPSALDGLGPFFDAASAVDARLRAAATAVNARITGATVTLDQATTDAIDAADPAVVRATVPAGLPSDLERAVLIVYNDLVSRHSAFRGVLRSDAQYALDCLRNGAAPAARFEADVAAARRLAAATPPVATPAPDSRPAEELAVRFAWIDEVNNGCASCGGMVIRDLVPITVYGAPTVPPLYTSAFDGEIDGVYFTAGYTPGSGWAVRLNAC